MVEKTTETISAELPKALLDALKELAEKRGVSANTVLQQAIVNEKFLSDSLDAGKNVLLQEADKSLKKLDFSR
jgi:predicted transcriptional regulator